MGWYMIGYRSWDLTTWDCVYFLVVKLSRCYSYFAITFCLTVFHRLIVEALSSPDAEENMYIIFNARQALMSSVSTSEGPQALHTLDISLIVNMEYDRLSGGISQLLDGMDSSILGPLHPDDICMISSFAGR